MIDLNNLLETYGLKGLILGVIIMSFLSIAKSSWFSNIWIKLSDKLIEWFLKSKTKNDSRPSINESDILNHDIFNYIDFWMYSKVPTLQFSTEYRTIIFRRYISTYLKCYKKGINDFVKAGKYKTMDQSELWKNLLKIINQIVFEYETETKRSGIPDIVISKMKSKNNDTIQLTIDLIESISNSQFYVSENNFLKLYSILNIVLSVLESTISHSESTCNSINGQLKGLSIDDGTKIVKEP